MQTQMPPKTITAHSMYLKTVTSNKAYHSVANKAELFSYIKIAAI